MRPITKNIAAYAGSLTAKRVVKHYWSEDHKVWLNCWQLARHTKLTYNTVRALVIRKGIDHAITKYEYPCDPVAVIVYATERVEKCFRKRVQCGRYKNCWLRGKEKSSVSCLKYYAETGGCKKYHGTYDKKPHKAVVGKGGSFRSK